MTISEEDDKEEYLNLTQNPLDESDLAMLISSITGEMDNDIWINAEMSMATEIQAELNRKKKDLPLEEQIPKEFHDFLDIFSEEKAARFPKSRPWDHKIELKDTFIPKSFKTYNLTLEEQTELDKFFKKIWKKAIYNCHNPLWHLHSSLLAKRTQDSDSARIIDISMNTPSRMHILFPYLSDQISAQKKTMTTKTL